MSARLERDARFRNTPSRWARTSARNDIEVRFEGEGGECALDGPLRGGREEAHRHPHPDRPREPHCSSRELYKGIVDGGGRGVFDGTIVVRKDAQKTDAAQTNKNLLLSRQALVHSTPRLEILADDVKCKHGSTTGQLDEAALFYLRSRGLSEAAARSLLVYAFASDLVARIRVDPVRRAVEAQSRDAAPRGARGGGGMSAGQRGAGAVPATTWRRSVGDFPILETTVHGQPLVYLDNAASAQKPRAVIEAERELYERYYSNIHRGVHQLSVLSTDAYEKAARPPPSAS